MVKKSEEDIEHLYRSKEWQKEERRKERSRKRNKWYCKDGSEAVFFVNATPNGELASSCKEVFKRQGIKVKVVEKVSNTIKKSLTKSNPFQVPGCNHTSCKVCGMKNKVNCKTRDVVYRISCKDTNESGEPCEGVDYVGETSRSIAERFSEHYTILNSRHEATRKKSFLFEHMKEKHDGKTPLLEIKLLHRCFADPSLRQAIEAVVIKEEDPLLNRKEEWNNEPRKRKNKKLITSGSNVTSGRDVTSHG